MASLNQLFIVSNVEPESMAPRDDVVVLDDYTNIQAIPISLRVNGDGPTILNVLNNINRSVREFDITSATIEWTNAGLSLQARANAFYMDEVWSLESEKVVRASDKTKKSGANK